ncbi:anti-sigma factor family protein [Candidatus Poribacteria bacterium]
MKCKRAQKLLAGYVNEVLGPKESHAVQEHIAECEICRRELDTLKNVLELIDNVKVEYPPTSVWENFLPDLHRRIVDEAALVFKKQRRQRFYLLPGWVAVAAIVLILSTSITLQDDPVIRPILVQRASNTAIAKGTSSFTMKSDSKSTLVAEIISELLITEIESEKLLELRSAIQSEAMIFPYDDNYDDADVLIDVSGDADAKADDEKIIKYLEENFAEFDDGPMIESDDSEFGAI